MTFIYQKWDCFLNEVNIQGKHFFYAGNKMINALYSILTFLIFIISFNAQVADASSLTDKTFNAASKEERHAAAKDLYELIEVLAIYLPAPKPSEIEWVEKEQAAIDIITNIDARDERVADLYESPELQHQKLYNLLKSVKTHLRRIYSEKVSLREEIFCWAVVGYYLSYKSTLDSSIPILIRSDRLPKDIADKARLYPELGYGERYSWYGRVINEKIIIPYLADKILQ